MAVSGVDPARLMEAAHAKAAEGAGQVQAGADGPRVVDGGPTLQRGSSTAEMEEVLQAARDFNRAFSLFDIQAHFSVHEATGAIRVDVIDTRTGDVIRAIPPKELLDRYAQLLDILGLMVDNRA